MIFNLRALFFLSMLSVPFNSWASEDLVITGEAIFDYRSDKIRKKTNTDETNIRAVSIVLKKSFKDKSQIHFEILGDENVGKEGLDLSLGEVYFSQPFQYSFIDSDFKFGVMKLEYGALNSLDSMFYKLPSYYDFMYGLPRGLDVGLFSDLYFLDRKLSIGMGIHFGKSLRATDQFQRKIYGLPYSTRVKYRLSEVNYLSAHYFVREYEGTPKIRGYGLNYYGEYQYKFLDMSVLFEWMNLNSNIGTYTSTANAYVIIPRLEYKKIYFSPVISFEKWSDQQSADRSESYFSIRGGVEFTRNFTFEIENLVVKDQKNNIKKEDSWLARLFLKWDFS